MDMLTKKPLEQNSCSKVLTLSEKKLTYLPKLYGTLMVVTNSTRMTSFTMCPGYHSVKMHLHKLNTNVQIITGHVYTPPINHSGTLAQYSNFRLQRISSNLISPISCKNILLPKASVVSQGCQSHGVYMVHLPRAPILY